MNNKQMATECKDKKHRRKNEKKISNKYDSVT